MCLSVDMWSYEVCLSVSQMCLCFRDSPVVQGNCILALSGLAVVLSRHESSLPAQSDGQVEVRKLFSAHSSFVHSSPKSPFFLVINLVMDPDPILGILGKRWE